MSAIIGKLKAFEEFIIVVINQDTMLNMPAEKWPQCDCLLSFFSTGFPFARAIRYCKLRKPIMINNLFYQVIILHRDCCGTGESYTLYLKKTKFLSLPIYSYQETDKIQLTMTRMPTIPQKKGPISLSGKKATDSD
jgi:hypothetical protein